MSFVLYRSSAGSGKTFTLVKEYLKIVLQDPAKFKNILAVTFTNKAAGEMKERIIQALRSLAAGSDPQLEQILAGEIGKLEDTRQRSKEILTHILHHYSDFAIMTIDSFIHKVIKAFALEIGLPLNFGIDLHYRRLETYAAEKLLHDVGREPFITDIILEFVFSRLQEEKSWDIEGELRRFEREILKEKNIGWVTGIAALDRLHFNDIMDRLGSLRSDYVKGLNRLGSRALDLIAAAGLTIDDFAYKEKGAVGFLKRCADLKAAGIKKFAVSSRFREDLWSAKSTPAETKAAIENLLANGLAETGAEIKRHIEQHHKPALTAAFILENIYLAAVINRLRMLIDEYKSRNNMIPISEFNVRVNEIVKHSPVPFIYAIMGEKYNHYLVDEFQDTSTLQWQNLFPLIENALGYRFFSMAVGDGKQSIYRWRGSDWEIMQTDILERIPADHLAVKTLTNNFRSKENIVTFNNRFFEKIREFYQQENIELGQIYSEISQEPVRKEGGFVCLELIEDRDTDADEAVFARVRQIIADCRAKGYAYGDIAVLVRENKEGQQVAEHLLRHRVPVVSPDSLIMARIPLVRFLMDVLAYINNPSDRVAESSLIYFLALYSKENPIDAAAAGSSFMEGKERDLTPQIREFFARRNWLVRLPVYEVIEEVVRIFRLQESLDFASAGYLQAFLDIAAKYTAEESVDISSFLDWWAFNRDEFAVVVPANKPAVRIMSIHKAKGLEFPVVIIPFANWAHSIDRQLWLKPSPPPAGEPFPDIPLPVNTSKGLEETYFQQAFKKEQEKVLIDNINLLYVAFTRAEDSLYIISQPKRKNENHELLKNLALPLMREEQAGRFGFGAPTDKQIKPEKPAEIEYRETDRLISNRWYEKISIRRKAKEFWRFDENYRTERRRWGILVHRVLARVRTRQDVPGALARALAAGEIDAGEKSILAGKIEAIFADERVEGWFRAGQRVLTEPTIITRRGILRPDRVIIGADKATIIDFKTGEQSSQHKDQVARYKEALRAMGYETIDAFLFYLEEQTIVPVTGEEA